MLLIQLVTNDHVLQIRSQLAGVCVCVWERDRVMILNTVYDYE